MNYSDDHIALAAEYALGTLDADERALVETMMIVDHGFKDVVDAWIRKLAPLHQMVGAIEPPVYVWDRIKAEVGLTGQQAPLEPMPDFFENEPEPKYSIAPHDFGVHRGDALPGAELGAPKNNEEDNEKADEQHAEKDDDSADLERELFGPDVAPQSQHDAADIPAGAIAPASAVGDETASNVVPLPRRKRGGVVYGSFMTAVAASLAAVVALQAYRPELLPEQLRVKPKIQTVEVRTPASAPGAQFVALLQQDASLPAFILTVDTATKNFTVRKVGAVPEPGKSYELWLVSDKLPGPPRSLGVIGGSDFTIRPALAAYDAETINKATYAVTIEPPGGSPTGQATGPIVFTGKLVESVPALPASGSPR